MILDVGRRLFRIGIKPRGILIRFTVHHDIVIIRRSLPGANGVCAALTQKPLFDGVRREVEIAFHLLTAIALGDDFPFPQRSWHGLNLQIGSFASSPRTPPIISGTTHTIHHTGLKSIFLLRPPPERLRQRRSDERPLAILLTEFQTATTWHIFLKDNDF
jgi:hypothetical protein